YWDYQRLSFPKNNGMRIDFILASKNLADDVTDAWIERDERKGKGPSDHVPVLAQPGQDDNDAAHDVSAHLPTPGETTRTCPAPCRSCSDTVTCRYRG